MSQTSGISPTITSAAMLATLPTVNRRAGVLIEWWNAATETLVTSRLDDDSGAQGTQPTDYNTTTNRKVWVQVA